MVLFTVHCGKSWNVKNTQPLSTFFLKSQDVPTDIVGVGVGQTRCPQKTLGVVSQSLPRFWGS